MWNQFRQYMTCGGNSANEMDNTMAAAEENCGGPIQNLPRFKRRSVVQKMFSSIDRPVSISMQKIIGIVVVYSVKEKNIHTSQIKGCLKNIQYSMWQILEWSLSWCHKL